MVPLGGKVPYVPMPLNRFVTYGTLRAHNSFCSNLYAVSQAGGSVLANDDRLWGPLY